METTSSPLLPEKDPVIDELSQAYLIETSKWGKFLAIVGYIGMGFLVLVGLGMFFGMSILKEVADMPFNPGIFGIIYLIIAVVYYFPVTYLYRYSRTLREGIETGNAQKITTGFKNLKSLFKFTGIITIVFLAINILMLLFAIPAAIIAGIATSA